MSTERSIYRVEFTQTIEVEAEDAVEAWEKAEKLFDQDSVTVYIDGNLMS